MNAPTHTATPSQPPTDSALEKSVTSSIIPATTQPLISPISHCPLALTGKCSSTLQHHLLAAHVGTASVGESTSQPQLEHSTHCTPTSWKAYTGPKELGYNKQERCLIYGKVKINGRWLERQKSGSANQPCQHFTSATPLRIRVQTQSILDMPSELTRASPAPSLWWMCKMEPAVGTTPLHSPATPVPALLISHPQPRAMRARVMPQDTTLDLPRLSPLVAPLLGEAGCPRPPLNLETSCTLSSAKVNDRYSGK